MMRASVFCRSVRCSRIWHKAASLPYDSTPLTCTAPSASFIAAAKFSTKLPRDYFLFCRTTSSLTPLDGDILAFASANNPHPLRLHRVLRFGCFRRFHRLSQSANTGRKEGGLDSALRWSFDESLAGSREAYTSRGCMGDCRRVFEDTSTSDYYRGPGLFRA